MLLNLTDLSTEPLHRQMFRQLRAQILAGQLSAEESLPSIRAMARDQRVSVITVQRAYDDLERAGLIRSRRGKGFFVAALDRDTRLQMAEQRALDSLSQVIDEILAEGLEPGQVRALVERVLGAGGDES